MEVTLAKTAGFCFGVQRAVDTVYQEIDKKEGLPIYTYGPIIHNEEVTGDFERKGVKVINSLTELKTLSEGCVIIRSHGVGKDIYDIVEGLSLKLVDATCPFVKKIHRIVKKASEEGDYVIVVGNPDHPEVVGICGWIAGPYVVVQNEEELREAVKKSPAKKITMVGQTTFNLTKFEKLLDILNKLCYDNEYYANGLCTICSATQERQAEAQLIASNVDTMIVIGGKNSSNTQKLYEICHRKCENTYYIQTLKDLSAEAIPAEGTVGITAGASTPKHIIEEVLYLCQNKHLKNY